MATLTMVVVLALIATTITLGWGLFSMSEGGRYDAQHSEQFMVARVGIQGFAVLMVLMALFLSAA